MAVGLLTLLAAAAMAAASQPASLAGDYDGSQTEIAAGLELHADGRFLYGLSYGALDEQAEGVWRADGGRVLLTSDPVKAPQFSLSAQRQGTPNSLEIEVERPEQLPLGLFDVAVSYRSGRMQIEQVSSDGLPFAPDDPPVSVRLVLPIFDVAGDPVPIEPGKGYRLALRFAPNDLGKVDFRGTALRIEGEALILDRHGRTLRFRKAER